MSDQYQIKQAYCAGRLEELVNEAIELGYRPVGGPIVLSGKDDVWHQAVIREDSKLVTLEPTKQYIGLGN